MNTICRALQVHQLTDDVEGHFILRQAWTALGWKICETYVNKNAIEQVHVADWIRLHTYVTDLYIYI